MKYLVSVLREMNLAATGGDERRSEMSICNQSPKDLGATSKRGEGRLRANEDSDLSASPLSASAADAGTGV